MSLLVLVLKILGVMSPLVPAARREWMERRAGDGFRAFAKKMWIDATLVVVVVVGLAADHVSQAVAVTTAREVAVETQQELQALRESSAETQRDLRESIAEAQQGRAEAQRARQRIQDMTAEAVALMRERDPSLTAEEALALVTEELRELRERSTDLEDQLSGIKMYSEVAKLNVLGEHQMAEGRNGLGWNSPLFQAMEAIWDERDGEYQPRCSRDSLTKLSSVAENFPSFPFSHLALAICAIHAGNVDWRQHASRAMEILKHTAQIAGSHPHHAASYRLLQNAIIDPSNPAREDG